MIKNKLNMYCILIYLLFLLLSCWQFYRNKEIAFIMFARAGFKSFVKFYIKLGVKVDCRLEKGGKTALIEAIIENKIEMVKFLIKNGANIDIKTKEGITALGFAVHEENLKITKLLIDKGANPNIKTELGSTPLFKAVIDGNFDIVKILVNNGADVNVKAMKISTPLSLASSYANVTVPANSKYKNVKKFQKRYKKIEQFLIKNGATKK